MVLGAVTSPGGHSNDDVWKAEMDGIPMEMPSATGTPTQGWWLGSPVPPGCWSTLSCCKQMGRKQILQVGEGFFPLVLSFFFFSKPKSASLGVRLQLLTPPWGRRLDVSSAPGHQGVTGAG